MNLRRPLFALAFAALALPSSSLAAIEKAEALRASTDAVGLTWTSPHPVDVYAVAGPESPIQGARPLARGVTGGAYALDKAGPERRYFVLVDQVDHQKLHLAERVVPLAQGSNFRDIGGYVGAGGKHVRWGLIYRSGAQPVLSQDDLAQVKALGVGQLVDLRSTEERALAPTRILGVPYSALGYSMADLMPGGTGQIRNGSTIYRNFPTLLAPHLKLVFASLLKERSPLVYNCSAGQDRTGFVTAMILSALGVSQDQIIADYHLSTRYRRPEFEMTKFDPAAFPDNPAARMFAQYGHQTPQPLKDADGHAFLLGAFDEINAKWGSVDGYLHKEIGLTAADITRLRSLYLE